MARLLIVDAIMTQIHALSSRTSLFVILLAIGLTGCETTPPRSPPRIKVLKTEDQLGLARTKHAAVALTIVEPDVLPDKLIRIEHKAALVIGGVDGPAGSSFFADLFDGEVDKPTWRSSVHTGAYSSFGMAELARVDLQATRMSDGKILVTGGSVCATIDDVSTMPCDPRMSECNCDNNRMFRNTILLFDPFSAEQDAWEPKAWYMKSRHTRHTVSFWSANGADHLIIFGGRGPSLPETWENFTYKAGAFDPPLDSMDLKTGISSNIEGNAPLGDQSSLSEWGGHTATLLNPTAEESQTKRFLLVGGTGSIQGSSSVTCNGAFLVDFDTKTKEIRSTSVPVPEGIQLPCVGHSAEFIGGKDRPTVAIVGGEDAQGNARRDIILFDVKQDKFLSSKIEMTTEHSFGASATIGDDSFLVAGGENLTDMAGERVPGKTIERCYLKAGTCAKIDELKCPRAHHTMTRLGVLPKGSNGEESLAAHFLVVGGNGLKESDAECGSDFESGFSSEILYLNGACGIDADCSPDYKCVKARNNRTCQLKSK